MTERRKFEVVKESGNFQIRKYSPCVMASVVVDADFEQSGNLGFRPLVSYISKNQIAMTAPVIQEERGAQSWQVSFVMPDGLQLKDLAQSSSVTLADVPEQVAAVVSFSGLTRWAKVEQEWAKLRAFIEREGLQAVGTFQIARFDPPWKPGFMRYNEIVQVVSGMKIR